MPHHGHELQDGMLQEETKKEYEWQIVWTNVVAFLYLHVSSIYAFYLMLCGAVHLQTVMLAIILMFASGLGLTAGAHRLWAHRAYKARWPLRLLLAILQTLAFQNHIYEWARDHRVHHKFTETDADPHNARRGFFFSHMGWLMIKKHKDVIKKGATIDMSDLEKDPIVMFQKKTFLIIMPLMCFVIPAWMPVKFWNENAWYSWNVAAIWRYTMSLHMTWLLNSVTHMWGSKPYDKLLGNTRCTEIERAKLATSHDTDRKGTIPAANNIHFPIIGGFRNIFATDFKTLAILTLGESWHNYHHVFPWDYKAGELGNYSTNLSTGFIDLAAKCGLAYDLKTVSSKVIRTRVAKTGDGTHPAAKHKNEETENDAHCHGSPIWGWNDKDMTEEDRSFCDVSYKND